MIKQELNRAVIRYVNVRLLINSMDQGNISAFAERIGKTREAIAKIAGKKFNEDQRIGDRLAEDIEAALQLDDGFLDRLHQLPAEVPPELIELLRGSEERLKRDAISIQTSEVLPILDWATAGQLISGELTSIPKAERNMLAPVSCDRGFFLQVNVNDYMPYIIPGMLLQIDTERRPTPDEVISRPIFVLVKRPEDRLPVLRLARAFGDLILYGAVAEPDPFQLVDPDDWQYGGMVVMRLVP